jgi:triphosphoribosyl-dephospho-CoA synthase
LEAADIADTQAMFDAIALAAPGGLGSVAQHDVRAPAQVMPVAAMAAAAERDGVARQWATGFADVFEIGIPVLAAARWTEPRWATLAVYLRFLALRPDSHIVRKHGEMLAREVHAVAVAVEGNFLAAREPEAVLPNLLVLDAAWKARGINPGTSADLTVATLFAQALSG